MHKLNILVAGKSGVGKSSLLNYIIGKENLFETGEGLPVTQDYFTKEILRSNGIEYHLFDTKGVEPDTTEEFSAHLTTQITRFREKTDVFEHIHTLYYCLGANNKRIEPFEISFIQEMSKEIDVVIILTKSDLVTAPIKQELESEIINIFGGDIKTISICSVSKKLRIGEVKPFGKEDFLKHAFIGLWNTFAKNVPQLDDMLFFHKEDCIHSNSTALRLKWYDCFTSNIFQRQDEIFIAFNTHTFFNLRDFISTKSGQPISVTIKFLSLLLNRVEYLTWDKAELQHRTKKILSEIDLNYEKIISFYSDLTGDTIQVKPLKTTKKEVYELSSLFVHLWNQILLINQKYVNRFNTIVKNPTWLGRDEEKLILDFENKYLKTLDAVYKQLKSEINKIESVYKAELHQFSDILIKKSFDIKKSEENLQAILRIADLSSNQKIYYNKVKALVDNQHAFDSDLREKLDFLRVALEISPQNAGLIEDFSRRS